MTPLRLVLIDDRVVTRRLEAWLETFADLTVVGIAASGEEALEHLDAWKADVVLQDLLMPGVLDGIETTRRIREHWPAVRVIALTASIDEPRMMAVLRARASGYIRKNAEPEELVAAVRAIARGGMYIDPAIATTPRGTSPIQEPLTPARGRGSPTPRRWTLECGHRRSARHRRRDDQDARQSRARQAARRQPRPGDRGSSQAQARFGRGFG